MDATYREFMKNALDWAKKAGQIGEIPIGAVLVSQTGDTLAAAHNHVIGLSDPSAHAEILVMRAAGGELKNYRLLNSTLYVTVEPCPMCMGAIIHARIARLVFGTHDPKWGAAGSLYDFSKDTRFNHHPEVVPGILEAECRELMQDFFRQKRLKAKIK